LSNKFYFDKEKKIVEPNPALQSFFFFAPLLSGVHAKSDDLLFQKRQKLSIVVTLIERSIKGIFVCSKDTKKRFVTFFLLVNRAAE
jgi:hypothetical protein